MRPRGDADRPNHWLRARASGEGARSSAGSVMDALSDVLRAVRLTGAVFFDVRASDPWVAETPPGRSIVGTIFPGRRASHLVSRDHRGSCWAVAARTSRRCASRPATSSCFRTGTRTSCRARPACAATPDLALYRPPSRWAAAVYHLDGRHADGEPAHIVCGFLGCDARPFNPLLTCAAAGPPGQRRRRRRARRVRRSSRWPNRRSRGSAASACSAA